VPPSYGVAVKVQGAVGPLFNWCTLKAGSLITGSDDARIVRSQNGGAHGRSRKQGEAEKRAHGNREGCEEGRHIPTIDHVGRWANAKWSILLWGEGGAAVTTGPAECRARGSRAAWGFSQWFACQRRCPARRVAAGRRRQGRVGHHPPVGPRHDAA